MISFSFLFFKKNTVLVGSPIFLLTENIKYFDNYYWVENSDDSHETIGHGKLCHADGSTWSSAEVTARYPEDGTIDLSNDFYIDTGWVASLNNAWNINGIYNVIDGVSYNIYTLNYDGVGHMDVYLYDSEEESVPTVPTFTGLSYTPPATSWKIYENAPEIIYADEIIYTMGTYSVNEIIYTMGVYKIIS